MAVHALNRRVPSPSRLHYERKRQKAQEARARIGDAVAAVFGLATIDWAAHAIGLEGTSLLAAFESSFGRLGTSSLMFAVTVGLLALKWAWLSDWGDEWVYYPPLHDEIVSRHSPADMYRPVRPMVKERSDSSRS